LVADASQGNVVVSEAEEPLGRDMFRSLFLTLPLMWQHMTRLYKTWIPVQHGQHNFTRNFWRRETFPTSVTEFHNMDSSTNKTSL